MFKCHKCDTDMSEESKEIRTIGFEVKLQRKADLEEYMRRPKATSCPNCKAVQFNVSYIEDSR